MQFSSIAWRRAQLHCFVFFFSVLKSGILQLYLPLCYVTSTQSRTVWMPPVRASQFRRMLRFGRTAPPITLRWSPSGSWNSLLARVDVAGMIPNVFFSQCLCPMCSSFLEVFLLLLLLTQFNWIVWNLGSSMLWGCAVWNRTKTFGNIMLLSTL